MRYPAPASGGHRRRNRRPARAGLVVLAAFLAAACGGGGSPAPSWPAGAIVVEAQDRTFRPANLVIPADEAFPLVLVNRDGDPHNISIRSGPGADAEILFRHDPIVATTVVLTAGPIPAGSYTFACEVHPQMTGIVVAN